MQAALDATLDVSNLAATALTHQSELGSGIGVGRSLITRIERRDATDRILISFAAAVFALVVACIWKARVWG